eukprot:TRINITY_DN12401_c0_g1_i1.p1 TRINITY_DN12401_c0_g1~~TRINITY_DN12401_c0_g1_i1.p1  ORF type:complete len:667 (+),score=125.17 TRINITY_DN12401_c0_g1_i1:78-2078(+)
MLRCSPHHVLTTSYALNPGRLCATVVQVRAPRNSEHCHLCKRCEMESCRSLALLGCLLLFAASTRADFVTRAELEGNVYESRACENDRGLTFGKRTLTFTGGFYSLDVMYYSRNTCVNDTVARFRSSGTWQLGEVVQLPYTSATAIKFFPRTKTLRPTTPEIASIYSQLCPNTSFTAGSPRNVLSLSCPALGLYSCPSGELDIIAEYHDALFLGSGGGTCSIMPSLLSTQALLLPGQRNILAVEPTVRYGSVVDVAQLSLRTENIMAMIEQQSAYFSRYYSTVEGLDAARDVLEAFTAAADCSNDNVEVEEVQNVATNPRYKQPSIIGRFQGKLDGPEGEALVIVSAHLDSANFFTEDGEETFADDGTENPLWYTRRAPGADDNLSGVAVLYEVFRLLTLIGFEPDRTVEFHLYAGEERGLVDGEVVGKSGSELIVRRLRNEGKEVVAAMNFDSIGSPFLNETSNGCNPLGAQDYSLVVFGDPSEPAGASIDPVSRDLFFDCVDEYTDEPWGAQYGPNGASDHQSFIKWGYPAGGGVESNIAANGLNLCGFDVQRHHTERDTVDGVDETYLRQWALSVLGYLIEVSAVPGGSPRFTTPVCPAPVPPAPEAPPPPMPFLLPSRIKLVSGIPPSPSTSSSVFKYLSSSGASTIGASLTASLLLVAAIL